MSEESSDNALRQDLEEIRQGKAPCPDAELLARYVGGELGPEEAARIDDHIVFCGICDALVELARQSDIPEEQTGEWESVERRVTQRFENFLKSTKTKRKSRLTFLSFLRGPIPAYVLVVMLVAYLGLVKRERTPVVIPPPQPPAMPSVQVIQLDATRSPRPERPLTASGLQDLVALSFFVPARPEFRYSVKITDQTGKHIAEQSSITSVDGQGRFVLLCKRQLFHPGRYDLTVSEINERTGVAGRSFTFEFTM